MPKSLTDGPSGDPKGRETTPRHRGEQQWQKLLGSGITTGRHVKCSCIIHATANLLQQYHTIPGDGWSRCNAWSFEFISTSSSASIRPSRGYGGVGRLIPVGLWREAAWPVRAEMGESFMRGASGNRSPTRRGVHHDIHP